MLRKVHIETLAALYDIIVRRIWIESLKSLLWATILTGGKQRKMVQARSVLCYWVTRELGMSAIWISKKLNIAASTASDCAMRGQKFLEDHGWKLLEENKSVNPRNVP